MHLSEIMMMTMMTMMTMMIVVSRYSRDSGSIPELIDIRWKLSYTANSSSGDRYFEPCYVVTFVLDRAASVPSMTARVQLMTGMRERGFSSFLL